MSEPRRGETWHDGLERAAGGGTTTNQERYACVDVGYGDAIALAACLTFDRWDAAKALREYVREIDKVQPYVPGEFYRRELPCILDVLSALPATPKMIVIDGYVWLDDAGRRGLGAHLFEALQEDVPVIGVAKTRFATATTATEVLRGTSRRPLFVSAIGMAHDTAAELIRGMHGSNRIPTLLKSVDRLSRTTSL